MGYSPWRSQRVGYNLVTDRGHMGLTFSQEPVNNGGLRFPFEVKLYCLSRIKNFNPNKGLLILVLLQGKRKRLKNPNIY